MFGGALPPIFIWGHGCMWGLASIAQRLGGVFQTVHRPGSPEAPTALVAVSGCCGGPFGCWLPRQDPQLPAGRPLWVLAPLPRGLELGGHWLSSARPWAPPAGSV